MNAPSPPTAVRLLYRADSHLMLRHVVEDAGLWEQLGGRVEFTFCDSPREADKAALLGSW